MRGVGDQRGNDQKTTASAQQPGDDANAQRQRQDTQSAR